MDCDAVIVNIIKHLPFTFYSLQWGISTKGLHLPSIEIKYWLPHTTHFYQNFDKYNDISRVESLWWFCFNCKTVCGDWRRWNMMIRSDPTRNYSWRNFAQTRWSDLVIRSPWYNFLLQSECRVSIDLTQIIIMFCNSILHKVPGQAMYLFISQVHSTHQTRPMIVSLFLSLNIIWSVCTYKAWANLVSSRCWCCPCVVSVLVVDL